MPAPLPERTSVELPPQPTLPQEARMSAPALHELRDEVAALLHRRDKRGFPGAQPVSFARFHLQDLQERDYYVCEKSDGIRCLLYLTAEGSAEEETAYLIDRKNDYYQVKGLHFTRSVDEPTSFFTNTLLDGELVNDREPDGRIQLRYLVFDCLVCDGQLLTERRLDKRLAYFQQYVYAPYRELFWKRYPDERAHQPFLIEMKKMELSYGTEMMFRQTLQNLRHGNDGLIFTCRVTPYQHGTDRNILKWKSADENSIDFKLHLEIPMYHPSSDEEHSDDDDGDEEDDEEYEDGDSNDHHHHHQATTNGGGTGGEKSRKRKPFPDYDAMPTLTLSVKGDGDRDEPFGTMYASPDEWERLKRLEEPLDERIVECYLDEAKRWRFMRFRDDKRGANHISTVRAVIDSIRDPVTREDLVEIAPAVKRAWKARNEVPQK